MNLRMLLIGVTLVAAPIASAAAMPVDAFLAKAAALERKGPMAFFSKDLKLLMNQIKKDGTELNAANKAAEAAGRPKAYCTPKGGVKLTDGDVLSAMRAVPAASRPSTSTKEALRAQMARRYPC